MRFLYALFVLCLTPAAFAAQSTVGISGKLEVATLRPGVVNIIFTTQSPEALRLCPLDTDMIMGSAAAVLASTCVPVTNGRASWSKVVPRRQWQKPLAVVFAVIPEKAKVVEVQPQIVYFRIEKDGIAREDDDPEKPRI